MSQSNNEHSRPNLPDTMPPDTMPPDTMPIPDNLVSGEFGLSDIQITTELHAGPLPSPDTVERYERLQPGTLDRLLTMAENVNMPKLTVVAG